MYSLLYSIIVKHPKFRLAQSVPEFIIGTISLKSPTAELEYLHQIQVEGAITWRVHYLFLIYRSGVGKYYIEVKHEEQNVLMTLGFVFKLSRDEVIDFFRRFTSVHYELYGEQIAKLLRYVRAALMGAKIREEIVLFDSTLIGEIYPERVHVIEKFSVRAQ